jgi:hypothetical protein
MLAGEGRDPVLPRTKPHIFSRKKCLSTFVPLAARRRFCYRAAVATESGFSTDA